MNLNVSHTLRTSVGAPMPDIVRQIWPQLMDREPTPCIAVISEATELRICEGPYHEP